MSRKDFFKKLIKYMLLILLGVIAIVLGKQVVAGDNCSGCPGNGICKGDNDCSKFLPGIYGG